MQVRTLRACHMLRISALRWRLLSCNSSRLGKLQVRKVLNKTKTADLPEVSKKPEL